MMLRKDRRMLLGLTAAGLLMAPVLHAEDAPSDMDGMTGMDEPAPLDESRQRLYDTAIRDDAASLEAAEARLAEAEETLAAAIGEGADPEVIESLERERDAAQEAVVLERSEPEALRTALEAMSDGQVDAANRALRNANANGTITDLDAATLMEIADRDLGGREIQALTKALEEEAKFSALGSRFEEKYDKTGREKFLEQSERMNERGAQQRDKFERKVDRFEDNRDAMRSEMKSQAQAEAREAARQDAKAEAKRAARSEARQENSGRGRGRN